MLPGGCLLTKSDEVLNQWREFFEELMALKDGNKAVISCKGMERWEQKIPIQETVSEDDIELALSRLEIGKTQCIG